MDRFADSRRLRSAGAADPPHRAALENSWADAAFQYPRDRQLCPNFIERRVLSSAIASHFGVTSDYHGALCQRVLLWGLAGSGYVQHLIVGLPGLTRFTGSVNWQRNLR